MSDQAPSPSTSIDAAPFEAPSPLRVGTDIVAVREVAESMKRFGQRYLARVYTRREIEHCARHGEGAPMHLAARFAAKEALIKVLRPQKSDAIDWQSIEVIRSADGAPSLALRGAAAALARKANLRGLALSMSHEAEYATAVVVAVAETTL